MNLLLLPVLLLAADWWPAGTSSQRRFDHRPFLYNVRWPWQFQRMDDEAAAAERRRPPQGAAAVLKRDAPGLGAPSGGDGQEAEQRHPAAAEAVARRMSSLGGRVG